MTGERAVRCDFCGFEFDPSCSQQSCSGCPVSRGCARIVCPRCGYQMLPEATLVGFMKSIKEKLTTKTQRTQS